MGKQTPCCCSSFSSRSGESRWRLFLTTSHKVSPGNVLFCFNAICRTAFLHLLAFIPLLLHLLREERQRETERERESLSGAGLRLWLSARPASAKASAASTPRSALTQSLLLPSLSLLLFANYVTKVGTIIIISRTRPSCFILRSLSRRWVVTWMLRRHATPH